MLIYLRYLAVRCVSRDSTSVIGNGKKLIVTAGLSINCWGNCNCNFKKYNHPSLLCTLVYRP